MRAGRDRAVGSEHQGQEGNFPRSLTGKQTSEVQGVGGNTHNAARRVILALCLKWDLLTKKKKVRSLWARSPVVLLCFGQVAPLWASVSSLIEQCGCLCTESHCAVYLWGGRNGHTQETDGMHRPGVRLGISPGTGAGGLNPAAPKPSKPGSAPTKGPVTSSVLVMLINGHRVHGRQQPPPPPLSGISYDLWDWVPRGVTI